jgi:hypothetical protein
VARWISFFLDICSLKGLGTRVWERIVRVQGRPAAVGSVAPGQNQHRPHSERRTRLTPPGAMQQPIVARLISCFLRMAL